MVDSKVLVHFTMWSQDGTMIHTTSHEDQPRPVDMNRVIPGWNEGLRLMVVGEKTRFWIPESIGYKLNENAPKGTLVFDVELFGIEEGGKGLTTQ